MKNFKLLTFFLFLFSFSISSQAQPDHNKRREAYEEEPTWTIFVENADGQFIADAFVTVKFTDGSTQKIYKPRDIEGIAKKRWEIKDVQNVKSVTFSIDIRTLYAWDPRKDAYTGVVYPSSDYPDSIGVYLSGSYRTPSALIHGDPS